MADLREIVLDTETTGLRVKHGHRIIEIGCVELINKVRTGKTFHTYLNPQRKIDPTAYEVHGISDEFIADKPTFSKVAEQFMEFIGNSNLIIHNAVFDMQFINQELTLSGRYTLPMHRAIDTLLMARKKFPGSQASLDALCRRFNISLHTREKHGALVDAELLALVYIEMSSGSQGQIRLDTSINRAINLRNYPYRIFEASADELRRHAYIMKLIKEPIWMKSDLA